MPNTTLVRELTRCGHLTQPMTRARKSAIASSLASPTRTGRSTRGLGGVGAEIGATATSLAAVAWTRGTGAARLTNVAGDTCTVRTPRAFNSSRYWIVAPSRLSDTTAV